MARRPGLSGESYRHYTRENLVLLKVFAYILFPYCCLPDKIHRGWDGNILQRKQKEKLTNEDHDLEGSLVSVAGKTMPNTDS